MGDLTFETAILAPIVRSVAGALAPFIATIPLEGDAARGDSAS